MIIKTLGILDVVIGILFFISGIFNLIPATIIFIAGLFLLIKGIVFISDFNLPSILDIISGAIVILSTLITMPTLIIYLVTIYLIQKGMFSLL